MHILHPKTNREQNWPISKVSWINSIFNRQWPNGSTEESVYATETWKRHVSAAFSCVSANVNPKLRLRKHLFPLAETWRKHAQKVVRFRCMCTRTLDHFLLYTFRSVLERAEKMFKAWYIVKFYANFATTKQLTFIGLFFRISMIGSSIAPTVEESFILLFFIGFVLSEIQQYRSSVSSISVVHGYIYSCVAIVWSFFEQQMKCPWLNEVYWLIVH